LIFLLILFCPLNKPMLASILKGLTLFIISLILCFFLGELAVRVFWKELPYEFDAEIGWKLKPNFSAPRKVVDQSGLVTQVNCSTNEFGFRAWGDLESSRKRILFVGDSYTGDCNTSNDDAYFGIVKKRVDAEVFAVGGGGYGTLQELLLLERYVDIIQPDIFVLQYCPNDIYNNSFHLEENSIIRNQKNLRPYLVNGIVTYRLPKNHPYILIYKNSKLFRFLDILLQIIQYRIYKDYWPQFSAENEKILEKEGAIILTEQLMSDLKNLMPPHTKALTFTSGTEDKDETEIWASISSSAGYDVYPSVSLKIEKAEKDGEIVRIHDGGHWNRLGNEIAGEELANILNIYLN